MWDLFLAGRRFSGPPCIGSAVVAAALAGGCARTGSPAGESVVVVAPKPDSPRAPTRASEAAAIVLPKPGSPGAPKTEDVPLPAGWEHRPATAAFEALLTAYGIVVPATEIDRECPTDESGASIDDIEEAAKAHGLLAEQVMLPAEYFVLPGAEAFPSLYVGVTSTGIKEFGVAWKRDGDGIRVFRPSTGRVDLSLKDFTKSLYVHEMPIPARSWSEWIVGPELTELLRERMGALGLSKLQTTTLLAFDAASSRSAQRGALDAAVRAVPEGMSDPAAEVERRYECALTHKCVGGISMPPETWSGRPAPSVAQGELQVIARGAVLIRISGKR